MKVRKTVLITGASSGIGYELAKIYANNGYNIIAVGRNLEKLKELKEILKNSYVDVHIISMDLSLQNAAIELYNKIVSKNLTVDILINNAGFGIYGSFSKFNEIKIEENNKMTQLNITFLVELTKIYLDYFIEKGSGGIINVSSIAGFFPGPYMANYYATKSYVLSFTEALWSEINNKNIQISVLCPGPTATNFEMAAKLNEGELFGKLKVMTPKKVAEIAYRDFKRGKRIIIPGIINKLMVVMSKFLPRIILLKLTKEMMKIKEKNNKK